MADVEDILFLNTIPKNIVIPASDDQKTFGILDVRPDKIQSPPKFTEQETLQAMDNLGIIPEDLVPRPENSDYCKDQSLSIQIAIELERKRLATIERIITERMRIINRSQSKTELNINTKIPVPKKRGKKKGKKKIKKTRSKTVEPCNNKKSKIPSLAPKKRKQSIPVRPSVRTPRRSKNANNDQFLIRQHHALEFKKKREEQQMKQAMAALARVEEVERRQAEIRRQQQAIIKEKAALRMRRLQRVGAVAEEELHRRNKEARTELARQERAYNRIRDRERRKFEAEQRWRMEKIYKQAPPRPHAQQQQQQHSLSRFAELRKRLLESKSALDTPLNSAASQPPHASVPAGGAKANRAPKDSQPPGPIALAGRQRMVARGRALVPDKGSRIPTFKPRK